MGKEIKIDVETLEKYQSALERAMKLIKEDHEIIDKQQKLIREQGRTIYNLAKILPSNEDVDFRDRILGALESTSNN